jgi:hypothetical protein
MPALVGLLLPLWMAGTAQADCVTNTPNPGCVHFAMRTDSSFDQYINSPTLAQQQWFQTHFWEMQVSSPYFDSRLSWFPRALAYFDLYGIHTSDPLVTQHPEWILKDQNGNWLYVNFACSGSTCSQYAFDFANAAFRQYQITQLSKLVSAGYLGIWLDDVDLQVETSNATGTVIYPVDSTTGQVMTASVWEKYIANFTTQIRQALPTAQMIHNSIWYAGTQPAGTDPYVQQEIQAADWINLERGVSDPNLTAGTGQYSLNSMLNFVDIVHSLGRKVIVQEYNFNGDYGLAGYYLISSGLDALGNDAITPSNWWSGYDHDLGTPLGRRYDWYGLFRRDYTNGFVLLNPYQGTTLSMTLGGTYATTSGGTVSSVSLAGGHAAVLFGAVTATVQEPVRINAGGPTVGEFMADGDVATGHINTSSVAISVAGVANAAPAAVYQTSRLTNSGSTSFTYTIPNLAPGGTYTVRMHFASDNTGVKHRLFNVLINGTQVLTNFDINATAGASYKAVVVTETGTADAGGNMAVEFLNGSIGSALVCGLEVIPTAAIQVNAGGAAVGSFAADTGYSGGHSSTITSPVTVTAQNAAPAAVYQTKRTTATTETGFTYTFPNLFLNTTYTVRLHFADDISSGSGQRVFNVVINGTTVLPNFDVYSEVGKLTADVKQFSVSSGTSGSIVIQFLKGKSGQALVNGIEILP